MLVQSASSLEDIIYNTKGPESYITARDLPIKNQSRVAELSTQPVHGTDKNKNGI